MSSAVRLPLHVAFPGVAASVHLKKLARLPTPVKALSDDRCQLFVKRDDQTNRQYGGNKIRKLEYLFAEALAFGREQVATFGAAGSNHATATAIHAQYLGLKCINFLSRQRQTPWVAANLRRQVEAGARLVYVNGTRAEREAAAEAVLRKTPFKTWLIPMGGSSAMGTLGYVNAAFELAGQIERGEIETPDRIYVAMGTMGTAVGLAVGLRAAGIPSTIVAVRVVHRSVGSKELAQQLHFDTVRLLRRYDEAFPGLEFDDLNLEFRNEQFGGGYALATDASLASVKLAAEQWDLRLETTYTGKALAALLADRDAGLLDDRNVLFWNTYCGDMARLPKYPDNVEGIPEELRQHFEIAEPA